MMAICPKHGTYWGRCESCNELATVLADCMEFMLYPPREVLDRARALLAEGPGRGRSTASDERPG